MKFTAVRSLAISHLRVRPTGRGGHVDRLQRRPQGSNRRFGFRGQRVGRFKDLRRAGGLCVRLTPSRFTGEGGGERSLSCLAHGKAVQDYGSAELIHC